MKWYKGLRLPNLVIIAINQYLLFYVLLSPFYQEFQISPALNSLQFALLVLSTMLVTAGGNVLNDLYDQPLDQINKPEKAWFKETDHAKVWTLYSILNVLGWGIAWFVAIQIEFWYLNFLYPAAAGLLWIYSTQLKRLSWYGNLLIAVFCGLVSLIVLYGEWESVQQLLHPSPKGKSNLILWVFWSYAAFAFITTLIRELIKDIEDREGDAQFGVQTYPVKYGFFRAKWLLRKQFWLLISSLVVLLFLLCWNHFWLAGVLLFLGLLFPSGMLYVQMEKASQKGHFSRLSSRMKFLMLAGLIFLPIFSYLYFP